MATMGSTKKHVNQHQHSRRSSPISIVNALLGASIGVAGFFAGTLYALHMGISHNPDCSLTTKTMGSDQDKNSNQSRQIEQEVQRRIQGMYFEMGNDMC